MDPGMEAEGEARGREGLGSLFGLGLGLQGLGLIKV